MPSAATTDQQIISTLTRNGYLNATKLCPTLQGSIWSCTKPDTKQPVIIKATNKESHKSGVVHVDGEYYYVHENIVREKLLLQYLTTSKDSPQGIVKYLGWFIDAQHYYLVMEDGGHCLFDFVCKVHKHIEKGQIEIAEWHKFVRLLFKQMVDTIDYMHQHNVAHFDISLENMLINDVNIAVAADGKISFISNDKYNPAQMKICDFGLAEMFKTDSYGKSRFLSNKYVGKSNYKSPEVVSKKETFNSASNDIWCLGVCLFMMLIGSNPWHKADVKDVNFKLIMDGNIMAIINAWNKKPYISNEALHLLQLIFQYEDKRITISELKKHPWLQ